MGLTVTQLSFDFGGSNPSPPTRTQCGSSSVDRASAFQAEGRGFEPRLPLKNSVDRFLSALFLFYGVMASEGWEIDLGCVLQSLRLSTDNEQNLCNLAHCVVMEASHPHLAASGKVGLNECRKLSKLAS